MIFASLEAYHRWVEELGTCPTCGLSYDDPGPGIWANYQGRRDCVNVAWHTQGGVVS